MAESFFATLKRELLPNANRATREEARTPRVRVHRGVVQSPASALEPGLSESRRLRTPAGVHPSSINCVSTKPGEAHCSVLVIPAIGTSNSACARFPPGKDARALHITSCFLSISRLGIRLPTVRHTVNQSRSTQRVQMAPRLAELSSATAVRVSASGLPPYIQRPASSVLSACLTDSQRAAICFCGSSALSWYGLWLEQRMANARLPGHIPLRLSVIMAAPPE